MVDTGATQPNLPSLDQVRQEEAEVTRRVAAARESAELAVKEARKRAEELKQEARQTGHRDGERRYKQVISESEAQANTLLAQAKAQAEELRRRGDEVMDEAVRHVLSVVLGVERSGDEA